MQIAFLWFGAGLAIALTALATARLAIEVAVNADQSSWDDRDRPNSQLFEAELI